ncbi:hypothetical protein [Virgibacillus sp. MSP4-1]|uniref:hypothetical protein n=1 Tax=Virgibacillus sp. MSP4-1 TaxID=2700081 RepID=UPI00039BA809|nr:hypothetical protein [Virgibacillus sp. MSP4-1]
MWIIHQTVLSIHIFLAIIWVGGILFVGWGIYPAIQSLSIPNQRQFLFVLMKKTHLWLTLAGSGVVLTGILLGTVLGPVRTWNTLWSTTYGNIWLTALVVGLFTLAWGIFVGYKQTMQMLNNDTIWKIAEKGYKTPLERAMFMTALLEGVEVIGFFTLLTLMMML